MVIRVRRHANVSKQATLLDGLDVSPLKWRVCGCGLNRFVHEGMNHISNVKVHLETRSGNVNICSCSTGILGSGRKKKPNALGMRLVFLTSLHFPEILTNRLNETKSAVFSLCRFSLFLIDPFLQII